MTLTSIVVPTYNERENLERLTESIHEAFGSDYEVLVVDDNSPDDTSGEARRLAEETDRNIRVIMRTEDPGLSQAVLEGFRNANGENIVVMDADLQHPPEKAREIGNRLSDETPVVVGTRYSDDGGIEDWSTTRKIVSRGAILLSEIAVPAARKSSDPVSGFFGVRADKLEPEQISPYGYKILLDVLEQVDPEEVEEVGYRFSERNEGESKLSVKEYLQYIEHLADLRMKHHSLDEHMDTRRAIRMAEFGGVGASGALVNTGIFMLTSELHYLISGLLAFLGAVQWNFLWNWSITFDMPRIDLKKQYLKFHAVSAGGFIIYEIALLILIGMLNLPRLPANIAAIFAGFIWNFFGSDTYAFNHEG